MTPGILTKYNASAGSGKTFRLTGVFLDYLFIHTLSYRNILAVTFTNKAAAEMKERILGALYILSSGGNSDYLRHLESYTGKTGEIIKRDALANLEAILHDYSRFSVGTIDSFFQKILRSFARESGLQAGFNLVLDPSVILSEAVDKLMQESDKDPVLLRWLTEYAYTEVQSGKNWNLKNKIVDLGKEIFKEDFRLLLEAGYIAGDKEMLTESVSELKAVESLFRKRTLEMGKKGLSILDRYNIDDDQLFKKSQGIGKFFRDASTGVPDKLSAAIIAAATENRYTTAKVLSPALSSAISDGLDSVVRDIAELYNSELILYKSARLVLNNLFTLGLLTDISGKVREILGESNKFLLSDAGDVLRQIIGKDQAPFIYEKVGNRYSNFMIDEFQDTSRIQWDNFLPLIRNSLAEGESNLVVGDIKQAIYRWRNSDWRIFSELDKAFHSEMFESRVLEENWRSCANIIRFNNSLFSKIPAALEGQLKLKQGSISAIYDSVIQNDPGKSPGGFVRIRSVVATESEHQEEIVLKQLPGLIEEIQDNGYLPGDIGILVRTNSEGQRVIDSILNYASTADQSKKSVYSYEIISQDSLLLGHNPAVKFILAALRLMSDDDDNLARASLSHHYLQISSKVPDADRPNLLDADKGDSGRGCLPEGSEDFLYGIRFLPVFEIIDRIIEFFGLADDSSGIPFITTLQDLVLELSGTEANDIPLFLEWWDNEGYKKSVASPEQPGAIQLMTIHKSKGLEFKVVILPFLSWTFNHSKNPVIWVHSDTGPFRKMGALPVPYKKEIADTCFSSFYEEEMTQVAIDRLNLLYVAFTRARECLFGFVPAARTKACSGNLVLDSIGEAGIGDDDANLPGRWDEKRETFTFGRMTRKEGRSIIPAGEGLDIPYGVEVNDSRLRISLSSHKYIAGGEKAKRERINYGLLLHELFESVETDRDIIPKLDMLHQKGRISGEQRDKLAIKIKEALGNEKVASWFSPGKEVRTESGILLDGGVLRRPDRVMISPGGVTIVDFKFGEESASHSRQLNEYRSIMEAMGYKNVEAYIWYVELGKVTEVLK